MDQPLGNAIGNWLETREAIDTLKGNGPQDLIKVTIALGAEMLFQAKKSDSRSEAENELTRLLKNGKAYEKFLILVKEQEGDLSVVEHTEKYPTSKYNMEITSKCDGYIHSINSLEIGLLANELGAGRTKMTDAIDYRAGIVLKKKEGDPIKIGEPLVDVAFSKEISENYIEEKIQKAIEINEAKPEAQKLILKYVNDSGEFDWPHN